MTRPTLATRALRRLSGVRNATPAQRRHGRALLLNSDWDGLRAWMTELPFAKFLPVEELVRQMHLRALADETSALLLFYAVLETDYERAHLDRWKKRLSFWTTSTVVILFSFYLTVALLVGSLR